MVSWIVIFSLLWVKTIDIWSRDQNSRSGSWRNGSSIWFDSEFEIYGIAGCSGRLYDSGGHYCMYSAIYGRERWNSGGIMVAECSPAAESGKRRDSRGDSSRSDFP